MIKLSMPKNRVETAAKIEDVLFRPMHQKDLLVLHGQTNCHCTRYLRHLNKNQKRKLISGEKNTQWNVTSQVRKEHSEKATHSLHGV